MLVFTSRTRSHPTLSVMVFAHDAGTGWHDEPTSGRIPRSRTFIPRALDPAEQYMRGPLARLAGLASSGLASHRLDYFKVAADPRFVEKLLP